MTNRDKPYLRYVFDVADTGVRRSSPELKPWEVIEENRAYTSLFEDQSKYNAIMSALAEVVYREMRKKK